MLIIGKINQRIPEITEELKNGQGRTGEQVQIGGAANNRGQRCLPTKLNYDPKGRIQFRHHPHKLITQTEIKLITRSCFQKIIINGEIQLRTWLR